MDCFNLFISFVYPIDESYLLLIVNPFLKAQLRFLISQLLVKTKIHGYLIHTWIDDPYAKCAESKLKMHNFCKIETTTI